MYIMLYLIQIPQLFIINLDF